MTTDLTSTLGDSKTLLIELRWNGRPFAPGDAWNLIWTLKSDPDTQPDYDAAIQKQTDEGISVLGQYARVNLVPIDTAGGTTGPVVVNPLAAGVFYWDIQAQRLADADDVRRVASGTLTLLRGVTRGTAPSIPIYVSEATPANGYVSPSGVFYISPSGAYYVQPAA